MKPKPETKPHQVRQYLYDHIPISKAMGLEVVEASRNRVEISAPLGPNINHRATVFGGSASALAIFSAWTLLHLRLTHQGIRCRLVIQRNSVNYDAPIQDTFTAVCTFDDSDGWQRFMSTLERRKRARITVHSVLYCRGNNVGSFTGDFVAIEL
ncbi:MAG: thioesterase [bacterium]|nr:thioesterase [bacterium]